MTKISIIVPIYNVEKYIKKCISSIKNQSFKDFKCYLINDGSIDKSFELAKRNIDNDERFILLDKENGGYGSVLEYAIKMIDTDYFLVCDPDDYLRSDCLEKLYRKAQEYDLDIVAGSRYNVFENSDKQEIDHMFEDEKGLSINNKLILNTDTLFFDFININPSPHAKLYRTKLSKQIIFKHKVSYTDNMLFYLSVINAKKVMYIDECLCYYLIDRSGNSMGEKEIKSLKQHLVVFNSIFEQCENTKVDYIFFRLFQSFKEIYYRYGKLSIYDKEIHNGLIDFLKKLQTKSREILKYYCKYSNEKIIARLKDLLLINSYTSNYVFESWLKKLGREI